jgi:hypothetical protein
MGGQVPTYGQSGTAAAEYQFAQFLQENRFDHAFLNAMLEAFMRTSATLRVLDSNHALCLPIARTLILIACEGERDPQELYQRTLNKFNPN